MRRLFLSFSSWPTAHRNWNENNFQIFERKLLLFLRTRRTPRREEAGQGEGMDRDGSGDDGDEDDDEGRAPPAPAVDET
ncbi:hypothetical protein ACHAWF_001747, partial [Thalassiosira exigua]